MTELSAEIDNCYCWSKINSVYHIFGRAYDLTANVNKRERERERERERR